MVAPNSSNGYGKLASSKSPNKQPLAVFTPTRGRVFENPSIKQKAHPCGWTVCLVDLVGQHSNPLSTSTPVPDGSGEELFVPPGMSREAWIECLGQFLNSKSELNEIVRALTIPFDKSRTALSVAQEPRPAPKRQGRWLNDKEVDQLVAAYHSGDSVPVLVERYRIHRTTVLGHLERRGVSRRAQKRKLSDAQVVEIRRLHRLGLSYRELGRRFGVSGDVIKKELGY